MWVPLPRTYIVNGLPGGIVGDHTVGVGEESRQNQHQGDQPGVVEGKLLEVVIVEPAPTLTLDPEPPVRTLHHHHLDALGHGEEGCQGEGPVVVLEVAELQP